MDNIAAPTNKDDFEGLYNNPNLSWIYLRISKYHKQMLSPRATRSVANKQSSMDCFLLIDNQIVPANDKNMDWYHVAVKTDKVYSQKLES